MSNTTSRISPEVRARAVRRVLDNEQEHSYRWATVPSIAEKIGCTAQTLNQWMKKGEMDSCARRHAHEGAEKLRTAQERENRELR